MDDRKQLIDQIREAAATQAYFSASRVQGHMFDLYGLVDTEDAKRLVETWLTLTIQRELFSGAELLDLLEELESRLGTGVTS